MAVFLETRGAGEPGYRPMAHGTGGTGITVGRCIYENTYGAFPDTCACSTTHIVGLNTDRRREEYLGKMSITERRDALDRTCR